MNQDLGLEELKLLQICETRNALESEGLSIAPIRLFEAYASENHLNEPLAAYIFEMTARTGPVRPMSPTTLNLYFSYGQRQGKAGQLLPPLKKEIGEYLNLQPSADPLIYLSLIYGFILNNKTTLKYRLFIADVMVNQWMSENNILRLPALPLAGIIKQELKHVDEVISEAFESGAMQEWLLYFLNLLSRVAAKRMEQLRLLLQLKKTTYDMIAKYTLYPLPAGELTALLFERPYIKAADIIRSTACHRQTASAYLAHLEKQGILIEKKSGREKLFLHKRLLDILILE